MAGALLGLAYLAAALEREAPFLSGAWTMLALSWGG
jgi:hypothetical protein